MPFRLVLAAVASALVLVPAATADGDPASDYLIGQDAYVPYPPPPASTVAALSGTIASVWTHGDRVKVAVIATPTDLGSVPSLFGHPADYARFLAIEIGYVYRGPLVVVMPAGFGVADDVAADPTAQAALAKLQPGNDAASLTAAAATAVRTLEQAGLLHVKDTTRPVVSVQPLRARRGRRVFLRYGVSDDSRTARVDLYVRTTADRTLTVFHRPFARAVPNTPSGVVWSVPRTAPAHLALCVQATDRAGNRSAVVCTVLTVS